MSNTTSSANDRQVGGDHYKTGGIELWDLFGPESIIFYAVRYVQRWRKKDGVRDLEKALHCVQKLREIAPRFVMRNMLAVDDSMFELWMRNSSMGAKEQGIIRRLVIWWKDDVELEYAQRQIEYLIRKESQVKVPLPDTKPLQEIVEESRDYLRDRERRVVLTSPDGKTLRTVNTTTGAYVDEDVVTPTNAQLQARERRVPRYDTPSCGDGLADDYARARVAVRAPWICDANTFPNIETDLFNLFYTKRAPDLWVLDPHVTSANIPMTLRHVYNLRGDGNWTLDIRKCPPDAREYFPSLPLSQNMKEWEERAEWQRVLYAWDEAESKYKLSEFTRAWHVDDLEYTE